MALEATEHGVCPECSTLPHWRRGRAPAWTWVSLALAWWLARRSGIGHDYIRT
jgi:hypothetical protein